jgi:hypothetical protein
MLKCIFNAQENKTPTRIPVLRLSFFKKRLQFQRIITIMDGHGHWYGPCIGSILELDPTRFRSPCMVDNLYQLRNQDQQLCLNKEVIACWTAEGYSYSGRGEIVELSREAAMVRLLEAVGRNGEYPKGKSVRVARFADHSRWSSDNCMHPVDSGGVLQTRWF